MVVEGRASALKDSALAALSSFRKKRRELHFYHLNDEENLSWRIKLSYCAPTLSTLPIVLLLAVYGTQFYEKLGADLAYISFFIALARSFDVVSDPLMSYMTDSFRSKHGRRRPFIITGCWVYGILLILLLSPPRLDSTSLSLWFGFFYVVFFLASTYTNIPYDALGPELTDNYNDRSRLFFVSGLFDGLGALIAVIFPVMLTQYINFTTKCPDPIESCFGKEKSCYTIAGSSDFTMYDLNGATFETINSTNCVEHFRGRVHSDVCTPGVDCYCSCSLTCDSTCTLENERSAYTVVGLAFALWYVVTMANCFIQIRERCQIPPKNKEEKKEVSPPPPMVPSMLNTLKNEPFKLLLPAWMCDAVVNGIVASMMTFYVRYVITPEYSDLCINDRSVSWKCDSQLVLGASVTMLLLVAFISTPMWLLVNQKFGKRNAWLAWSCSMAITNILYIFLGPGDVMPCIIITGINGMPFGAKFLADAILADIIDYDDFLSGARSEATYTMFKSFLPKICAIPASAIPIAILNSVGHVPPVNGVVQPQSAAVMWYIRVVTVLIPTAISVCGFIIKTKFPFKTKDDVDMITEGVGKHLLKQSATDPVSKAEIAYISINAEEQAEIYRLDYFPSVEFIKTYKKDIDGFPKRLVQETNLKAKYAVVCFFSAVSASYFSFGLMTDPQFSFIPVVAIISVGVSMTLSGFFILRWIAAKDLLKRPPTVAIVEKALIQRLNIEQTHSKKKSSNVVPSIHAEKPN